MKNSTTIKNHTLGTGKGIIRGVEYSNCVFTICDSTTFKDCTFLDCTFENNRFVTFDNGCKKVRCIEPKK